MKLRQKIKHFKRHKRNKHIKQKAEAICTIASEREFEMVFVVNPLMYEVIRFNNCYTDWVKSSPIIGNNTDFIIVPKDNMEFYNDNEKIKLEDICVVPSIEDYFRYFGRDFTSLIPQSHNFRPIGEL